jgi:stearoyl-CoA desaturase (delta-9 desaturase)
MSSVRQGFSRWEIDISYYGVKLLGWLGIVWDLREPPPGVLDEAAAPRRPEPEGLPAPACARLAPR